ncbi:MAG: ribonuclease P protein component [Rhodospirillaceae bacterium]|nr:ribonuclease P protein component [Rhodospirillaceae bacterium]
MALVLRLTRRAEFLRAARQGRKSATPGLVLQAVATPALYRSEQTARLGFTASRKVGGAVVRNRVKRRLRAAADLVIKDHADPGYDYVLIGRAQTATRPFTALLQDLETALKRLGRFTDVTAVVRVTSDAPLDPQGNGTPSS